MKGKIFGFIIILSLILTFNPLKAQSIGISAGYSSSSAGLFDLYYQKNQSTYHLGMSYQFADTRGKLVSEQKSNYGRTTDGGGDYFWTVDLGYGYYVHPKVSVNAELSLGSKNQFTNYIDNRFNGGGYHMVDESKVKAGIGANIGYNISEFVNLFAGYNTLREITFGIRVNFSISY